VQKIREICFKNIKSDAVVIIRKLLCLFQEQVDHQQVTEQMTSVAIDDSANDWGQTETSQTDWRQQSESQTDWNKETETQAEWNSSPANQNDCKCSDIVCQRFCWQCCEALWVLDFDTK
jgi:hypothetical protein